LRHKLGTPTATAEIVTGVMNEEALSCRHWGAFKVGMTVKLAVAVAALLFGSIMFVQAQSGSALPAGFFHVANNQIVSDAGVNVRLSCIGYDQPTGHWSSDMRKIRSAGFGCVRYSWYDAITCSHGRCSFKTLDEIVAAAAANNLKVIFSHHGNEGANGQSGNAACVSQQENGLWYDVNSPEMIAGVTWNTLIGNYDGCGTPGTVTYATFKVNSVALAVHYSRNSTVIGFDLWNEPIVGTAGKCGNGCQSQYLNWGGNNGSDLRLMCSDTGAAVEAADPGVLIICEGAINFTGTFLNGARMPAGANGIQELTLASTLPVNVGAPAVVYSVHHYPGWLSGQHPDAGVAAVTYMNLAWGYLVTDKIAPVWVGEAGASLDGSNGLAKQRNEVEWATTLVSYLNGEQHANGGPAFSGDEQPIGSDWWYFGYGPGQQMNGIYASVAMTSFNRSQERFWRSLHYKPSSLSPAQSAPAVGTR
jgi:endoglucanase